MSLHEPLLAGFFSLSRVPGYEVGSSERHLLVSLHEGTKGTAVAGDGCCYQFSVVQAASALDRAFL